jgi:hypothetical protein
MKKIAKSFVASILALITILRRSAMKTKRLLLQLILAFLPVFFAASAMAATVTLTMDEVGTQLINGLTVTKGGEGFTFSNPSQTLYYDSFGPGIVTYVQDPTIQGSLSSFSVAYSNPVYSIQFGLAESAVTPLTGARVSLFNGVTPTGNFLFDLPLVDPYAEGRFSWSGGPVTSMTVDPAAGPQALAFDNLTVNLSPVPEPSTYAMMLAGLGLIGFIAYRRKNNSSNMLMAA